MESGEIITLVIGVLLTTTIVLLGGYAQRLKNSIRDLRLIIAGALEDGQIDDKEVANILRGIENVGKIALAIAYLYAKRLTRKT